MQKTFENVVCPLCSLHRPIERKDGTKVSFNNWDGRTFIIVKDCSGGKVAGTRKGYRGVAKAVGFPKVREISITDAYISGKYDWLFEQLKDQVIYLARLLISMGILDKNEI